MDVLLRMRKSVKQLRKKLRKINKLHKLDQEDMVKNLLLAPNATIRSRIGEKMLEEKLKQDSIDVQGAMRLMKEAEFEVNECKLEGYEAQAPPAAPARQADRQRQVRFGDQQQRPQQQGEKKRNEKFGDDDKARAVYARRKGLMMKDVDMQRVNNDGGKDFWLSQWKPKPPQNHSIGQAKANRPGKDSEGAMRPLPAPRAFMIHGDSGWRRGGMPQREAGGHCIQGAVAQSVWAQSAVSQSEGIVTSMWKMQLPAGPLEAAADEFRMKVVLAQVWKVWSAPDRVEPAVMSVPASKGAASSKEGGAEQGGASGEQQRQEGGTERRTIMRTY